MAVFRIEKTRDYTVMANHHLRNTALSLKAKGLLSLMLSLPEDWDYTTKGLARICRDGVDSICATVRELEDAGYIIRARVRNANGRLGSIEYTILEQPRPPEPKPGKPERENPVQVKPVLDSPVLGKPEQENPAQLNTKGSSNQISNTDLSSTEGSNPIQSSPQTPAEAKRTGRDWMRERENYRELILENIEYDYLCRDDRLDRDMLNELVELMVDTVCSRRETIRIAGDDYPAEVVKSRFLKLNSSHVEYVLMLDGKFASIEERLEAVAHAAPEDFHSRMEELKDAVGYEEFLDMDTEALREAIQNPDTSRVDEMLAFAEQAEREYVAELARETAAEPTKMTVLVVEPMKEPDVKQIASGFRALQAEVNGDIAASYPFANPVALVVTDEGKLIGLDLNRSLRDDHGEIYDIVAGTFLVVGLGEEDFTSLSPDMIQKYTEHFKHPELFASISGQIVSVPVEPDNPLRTAEMILEDDYGMIDGVINNGRRGEEQEKATENSEKKTSIMDRLADAKKACADRKPSEKAEHHKKAAGAG